MMVRTEKDKHIYRTTGNQEIKEETKKKKEL